MNSISKYLHLFFWTVYIAGLFYFFRTESSLLSRVIAVIYVFFVHWITVYVMNHIIWKETIEDGKYYLYLAYILIFGLISAFIITLSLEFLFKEKAFERFERVDYSNVGIWSIISFLIILIQSTFRIFNRLSLYNFLGLDGDSKQLAEMDAVSAQGNKALILNHMYDILKDAKGNEEETVSRMRQHIQMIDHLYSDTAEEQLLTKEIQFLVDFNALQIQKEPELKYRLNFDFDGDIEVKRIIPLALFPFYEKAIYFVSQKVEESQIKSLIYGEGNFIRFQIFSDFPASIRADRIIVAQLNTRIMSARRRLMEAYPDSHELIVNENDTHYNVFLRIDIK